MVLIKLILRNIFSHKLRSTIIFIVISLVFSIMFLFLAFADGTSENMVNSILSITKPKCDIVVTAKGFLDSKEANEKIEELNKMTISDYQSIRDKIQQLSEVSSVYVHTQPVNVNFIINEKRYKPINFFGIEPDYSKHITSNVNITEGRFFENSDNNVILMHSSVGKQLNIKIGDTITTVGTDLFGQSITENFTVIGFYKSKIDSIGLATTALIDMNGYLMISGLVDGEASTMNINLKKNASLKESLVKLKQMAKDNNLNIEFNEFNIFYKNIEEIKLYSAIKIIVMFLSFIVIFIIMFGIMNVVSLNLKDRRKEIGSYYCLGAEKWFLNIMYSSEILIINVLSSIVGLISGLILRFIINSINITTDNPGFQIVLGGEKLYLGFNIYSVLYIFIIFVLITIITSFVTLGSALKVSPSVAVREVEE